MSKAPCKHAEPRPHDCRWCDMAVSRDARYLRLWWPDLAPRQAIKCNDYEPVKRHNDALMKVQKNQRPCIDKHPTPVTSGCGTCHLFLHDPSYRQRWAPGERKPTPNVSVAWSYGVMTVPERLETTLMPTLISLRNGGFDRPHLFIDGCNDPSPYKFLDLQFSLREPAVGIAGNWVLSMYELYYRNPNARYYALFQDDFITYNNLRQYLELTPYPAGGYCNLYTFPSNQGLAKGNGWYKSNQRGLGAIALVFDRTTLCLLLRSQHLVERVQNPDRGHKAIDGGIVTAMKKIGIDEYVHNPSLVQHTGMSSTTDKRNGTHRDVKKYEWKPAHLAKSFMGGNFDALELLRSK
jgi:hypothetical protein